MTSDGLPRFADPRTGGCGNRREDEDGELAFCGTTPAPFELRLGPGGKAVARLCRLCAERYRRKLSQLREQGVGMDPELMIERVEPTS